MIISFLGQGEKNPDKEEKAEKRGVTTTEGGSETAKEREKDEERQRSRVKFRWQRE